MSEVHEGANAFYERNSVHLLFLFLCFWAHLWCKFDARVSRNGVSGAVTHAVSFKHCFRVLWLGEMNGVLNSVAIDVYPDETVVSERSNFKLLAEEGQHFCKDGFEVADDETVVNVEDEDSYFFICIPLT